MRQLLARIAETADPQQDPFLNPARVEMIRRQIAAMPQGAPLQLKLQLGYEQMLSGQTEAAIAQLEAVRRDYLAASATPSPRVLGQLGQLLALANLRLGEQENCVAHHGIDSCLMPIRGGGIHTERRGSTAAVKELTALLNADSTDVAARWLLNLAYMTLGEYPQGVPRQWLIPPEAFESQYPLKRFYDAVPRLGLDPRGLSGGAVMDDFNGDGNLDIFCSSWGLLDPLHFYRNNADGTLTDRAAAAGLEGIAGGLNICQADYNNDGWLDVLVLRGAWRREAGRHPVSLLKNLGDGTFEDVTEAAGLLRFHPTQTGAWADYDGDGWLDLFVGNETTDPNHPHPCELFHSNRDGTFTEVAARAGLAYLGFVKGVAWGDYNNDGRPDLYLSCLNGANVLFRNDGPASGANGPDWKFTDVTAAAGVAEPQRSFPTWFWDYDNDGWLDLLVASFSTQPAGALPEVAADVLRMPNNGERPRLYRNKRDGTFEDVTRASGLYAVMAVMGSNYGDLDNDGWLDCYFGTGDPILSTLVPNRMFRNDGGRGFQDVTTSGGFGHLQKGHGVAFGDLDNDGDQDVFEEMGGAYSGDTYQSVLNENPGFGHAWVTLRLQGVRSNRSAIGTRIRVHVETPAAPRHIFAVVSSGSSFGGNSLQQEMGLGNAVRINWVEVTWPATGRTQRFVDVPLGRVLRIREDSPTWTVEPVRSFRLGGADKSPG